MPKLLSKTIILPKPPRSQEKVLEYLERLNNSLVRGLDDVYSNFQFLNDVGDWDNATDTQWARFALKPLATAPTGEDGMIAVCDGSGWDPGSDGNQYLMLYLNSGWVRVSGVT